MTQEFLFTVFTPTYNRAHLLPRVYDSLKRQTLRNFEWVIVDDGSSDNTRELVAQWAKEAHFPIIYRWQQNSGKHVAINRGVELARGEFFVILDSDDWLKPNALERLFYHWSQIPAERRSHYAGVCGLYAHPNGKVVGTKFPVDVLDSNAVEIRTRYRVKGDKFGMNRTEVMREFPFPEDLGHFVTESLIWNRIAKKYSKRYVNEILAVTEYQAEGLSARSIELRAASPKAARLYYQEFANLDGFYIPVSDRLKAFANYVRFSLHDATPFRQQLSEIKRKELFIFAFPIGLVLFWRDKKKLR